jgi:hypothetical protein
VALTVRPCVQTRDSLAGVPPDHELSTEPAHAVLRAAV